MRILSFLFIALLLSCNQKKISTDLFLPDDLEATLWAQSPLFYNPTNMDVDIKGRIWITEAVNYRNFNNDSTHFLHHPKGDRVMILQDTDGDGEADVSTLFVEDKDLISPMGIAVIGNKIFVSCAPHLIVYTDADDDDKPDSKEIFLTGFGGKDHDHSLHSLVAGPDGNYYFNTGNAGPHLVTDKSGWTLRSGSVYTGGTPYNLANQGNMKSDDGHVWVGGLALRVKSDGTGLKVMGHNFRNSYEVMVDSYGNLWQNDNDDQVVACRTSWLMEGGNAGYFSTDGTRYWQADQRPGQDIFEAHWHQDNPGVMPAGDQAGAGSPTGVAINESDALGSQYLGMVLSAEAGRNVIFGYKPALKNSGYDIGKRTNLISSLPQDNERYVWNDSAQNASNNKWFRPSDVTIGTDGAIYIADWHDPVVGGHQMQDSVGYGRIYRITAKGKNPKAPNIDLTSTAGQIEALKNPAINVRYQGFKELKANGENVVDDVMTLLNSSNPYHKARAVWLLSQLGEKGKTETMKLLEHSNAEIRTVAFRALRQIEKDIIPLAEKLSDDPSPFVRREVAIALRDLPFEKIKLILLKLMETYDGQDRWYLEAIGAVADGHAEELYAEVKTRFGGDQQKPEEWNAQLASILWRLHPAAAIPDFEARALSLKLSSKERVASVTALAFTSKKESVLSMISLTKSKDSVIAEQATYWLAFRQSNDWFDLLDWNKVGVGIDLEHARALSIMKVKRGIILDERQSIDEKRWNARAMAKDAIGGQMLLSMRAENILPSEIIPEVEALIFNNPDLGVRVQAANYFKKPGSGKTYSIGAIAKMKGNSISGEALFSTNCSSCHRVKSKGMDVGPNLTDIKNKFQREALLDAIVNPNAGIVFGYEAWLITTKSGDSFYGFLVADGAQAVVIKDLSGNKNTIPNATIASRKKQSNSLMPEPSSLGLTDQNLADIVEYLITMK